MHRALGHVARSPAAATAHVRAGLHPLHWQCRPCFVCEPAVYAAADLTVDRRVARVFGEGAAAFTCGASVPPGLRQALTLMACARTHGNLSDLLNLIDAALPHPYYNVLHGCPCLLFPLAKLVRSAVQPGGSAERHGGQASCAQYSKSGSLS